MKKSKRKSKPRLPREALETLWHRGGAPGSPKGRKAYDRRDGKMVDRIDPEGGMLMQEGYRIMDWDDEECCPVCGQENRGCICPDPLEICEDCEGDCDHCMDSPHVKKINPER